MKLPLTSILLTIVLISKAQKPEDTEQWTPVPPVVTPVKYQFISPPKDAIILFDGKNLNEWVATFDRTKPADWTVKKGTITVNKQAGNIETLRNFSNFQLHIEWMIPANITGKGQGRGNSGIFLSSLDKGDGGYELQLLDSYENSTYVNGMAGSIYKQSPPLANAARKPGEWQTYDISWSAPVFNEDGSLKSPAKVTVLFNGIVVQNNFVLEGPTQYIGKASYKQSHGATPIKLQAHGDPSEPISFRNIWVREL